jgi:hypothetical protein
LCPDLFAHWGNQWRQSLCVNRSVVVLSVTIVVHVTLCVTQRQSKRIRLPLIVTVAFAIGERQSQCVSVSISVTVSQRFHISFSIDQSVVIGISQCRGLGRVGG